jgi:hypothetical protein
MTSERGKLLTDFQFDCGFEEYRAALNECVLASPTLDLKAQQSFVVKAFEFAMWWWNLRKPVHYRIYETGYEKTVRNKAGFSPWPEAIGWSETELRIWILHNGGRSGFSKSAIDNTTLCIIRDVLSTKLGDAIPLPSLVEPKPC